MSPVPFRVDGITSRRMAAVRKEGTKPELAVRRVLWRLGIRLRSNVTGLPGTPDLANKKLQLAIFVHGCFWHQHAGCPRSRQPKTHRWWWRTKLRENVARDDRKVLELRKLGFRVVIVWECQTRDEAALERFMEVKMKRYLSPTQLK